jgi:hypothetical protein
MRRLAGLLTVAVVEHRFKFSVDLFRNDFFLQPFKG